MKAYPLKGKVQKREFRKCSLTPDWLTFDGILESWIEDPAERILTIASSSSAFVDYSPKMFY